MKKAIALVILAILFAAPLATSVKADGVPLPTCPKPGWPTCPK